MNETIKVSNPESNDRRRAALDLAFMPDSNALAPHDAWSRSRARLGQDLMGQMKFAGELAQVMPNATPEQLARYTGPLYRAMKDFGIAEPEQRAAFLANIAGETGQLRPMEEGGVYKDAVRATKIFPSKFKTPQEAAPYMGDAEKLLNHVYADRLGNGPEGNGNGYRFRGRGPIQLTGRKNYSDIEQAMNGMYQANYLGGHYGQRYDLVGAPQSLLADPDTAARSAAAFWASKGANDRALAGGENGFEWATQSVNEHPPNMPERLEAYRRARKAMGLDLAPRFDWEGQ
jgi:putative chitinase